MKESKNSFLLYTEQKEVIDKLSDEQAGQLIKAIYKYANDGEMPELEGLLDIVIIPFKQCIDKNNEKYEEVIKKRSEAGKLGGRPKGEEVEKQTKAKKANAFLEKQTKAKKADNDNVNENVNVNDNDLKDKEKPPTEAERKPRAFIAPTLDEVLAYSKEFEEQSGKGIDCERFIDFYESKNWMVGKNKMKDWKAALRNWARQDSQFRQTGVQTVNQPKVNRFVNYSQRNWDFEELEKMEREKLQRDLENKAFGG